MIFRSAEQTFEIYARLSNDGKVKRRPKDFQSRLGVTQEPLIDADLQMISPLHTMLRTWDFIIKLIGFLRAGIYIFFYRTKYAEKKKGITKKQNMISLISSKNKFILSLKFQTQLVRVVYQPLETLCLLFLEMMKI